MMVESKIGTCLRLKYVLNQYWHTQRKREPKLQDKKNSKDSGNENAEDNQRSQLERQNKNQTNK